MDLDKNMDDKKHAHARREDFLIEYYKVLWGNVNRHIQGVWQTVTTLGGSFALLTLVGNEVISYSWAIALIVGLCAWCTSTVYDSGLWFARNQAIAANIERLFFLESDETKIQPYFKEHREEPLISHFEIALWLSRGLVFTLVLYHLIEVVYPLKKIDASFSCPEAIPYAAPYIAFGLYIYVERKKKRDTQDTYESLIQTTDPTD